MTAPLDEIRAAFDAGDHERVLQLTPAARKQLALFGRHLLGNHLDARQAVEPAVVLTDDAKLG